MGIALWGAATDDGAPMLGAALTASAGGEALLLVTRQPSGGQPFSGLALPGEVGLRAGGNQSGLVLLAFPFATVDRALEGLPTRMLLRVALADTHSRDEALRLLVTLPRTGGASFLIADAAGDTVQQVELSARQSRRVAPEGEALRVAGAPLEGPLAAPADLLRQDDEAARGRLALWLRTARGPVTRETLQTLLGEPALSRNAVAALVWLPKQGDLWLAQASGWRRVDLADGE